MRPVGQTMSQMWCEQVSWCARMMCVDFSWPKPHKSTKCFIYFYVWPTSYAKNVAVILCFWFFFFSLRFDFTVWLEFSSDTYSCTEGDFDVCTNGIPSVIFRLAHKWPPSNTWTTLAVQSMQWTYYIMIILWYIYVYFVATSIMVSVNYCRSNRFSSFWLLFSLFSSHFSSFLLDTAVSAFITQNKRLKCLFTT